MQPNAGLEITNLRSRAEQNQEVSGTELPRHPRIFIVVTDWTWKPSFWFQLSPVPTRWWFSPVGMYQKQVRTDAGPHSGVRGVHMSLGIRMSNKFPGEVVAGPGNTLCQPLVSLIKCLWPKVLISPGLGFCVFTGQMRLHNRLDLRRHFRWTVVLLHRGWK